jgi:hypothetical protein
MSTPAASLLDVEPALAGVIGARDCAAFGHTAVLPVVLVAAGAWSPPARGAGTLAFVVLEGLLVRVNGARDVFGPGDRIDPWSRPLRWAACTEVRLALIGREYTHALSAWPTAAARLLARRRPPAPLPGAADADDRLLDLLWRLAHRWGRLEGGAILLPPDVGMSALALVTGESEPHIEQALARLATQRSVSRRARGRWALPGPGTGAAGDRRHELRARAGEQFAVARQATRQYTEVSASLEGERRRARRCRGSARDEADAPVGLQDGVADVVE